MKIKFSHPCLSLLLFIVFGWSCCSARGEQTAKLGISEVQPTPVLAKKYLSPGGQDPARLASLPEIIEAINNQTAGRLQTMREFNVVEPGDLRNLMGRPAVDSDTDLPAPAPAAVTNNRPTQLVGKLHDNGKQFSLTFSRLESQSEAPVGSTTNDPQNGALDLQGKWQGLLLRGKSQIPSIMEITRKPDGTFDGIFQNVGNGKSNLIANVEFIPPFLKIKYGQGNFGFGQGTFIADLNSNRQPLATAPRKLRQSFVCDLKDPTTVEQFKQSGIQYLLAMTLEDFDDQTLDLIKAQSAVSYVNAQNSGSVGIQGTSSAKKNQKGAHKKNGQDIRQNYQGELNLTGNWQNAQSAQAGVTRYEPNVRKQQTVHLSIRYRLFDATTGTLLGSQNYSFSTNRIYTALAAGSNEKSTADLYQSAARIVADWAAVQVVDTVFPMKVLEKNDNQITVNRGIDSGIRVSQVYNVYEPGEEIKDPSTGESLGRKEITVGRVVIEELHPQFSSAKVLNDSNIISGAFLRLAK